MNIPRELGVIIGYHLLLSDGRPRTVRKYVTTCDASERLFLWAIPEGDIATARLQVQLGVSMDIIKKGLLIACECSETDIAKMLIPVTRKYLHQIELWNCINFSVWRKNSNLVKMLIEFITEINDYKENSIFLWACSNGRTRIVKKLLDVATHTYMNTYGHQGFSAACENGHAEIVKMLIRGRLSVYQITADNNEAFALACRNGHTEIVKMLIPVLKKFTADIEKFTADMKMEFIFACSNGYVDIVRELLTVLTPEDIFDRNGTSRNLWDTYVHEHKEIMDILMEIIPKDILRKQINVIRYFMKKRR